MTEPLRVDNLRVTFFAQKRPVQAVRNVSLHVREGEILGLIGESGSGKSALCAALMNLHDAQTSRTQADALSLTGDVLPLPSDADAASWRSVRGRRVALISQDPMTALNPYRRIGSQLQEALQAHRTGPSTALADQNFLCQALQEVGLAEATSVLRAFPHMLSGGMRQRVIITMALLGRPQLLLADEPTTALDVTVQAQILVLLKNLCLKKNMAMLFVTHDLAVLSGIAHRIAVMYAGQVVEIAATDSLYQNPKHPYSRALWRAMPDLTAANTTRPEPIAGHPPNLAAPQKGCAFAPRCPRVMPICRTEQPLPRMIETSQLVLCHNPEPSP